MKCDVRRNLIDEFSKQSLIQLMNKSYDLIEWDLKLSFDDVTLKDYLKSYDISLKSYESLVTDVMMELKRQIQLIKDDGTVTEASGFGASFETDEYDDVLLVELNQKVSHLEKVRFKDLVDDRLNILSELSLHYGDEKADIFESIILNIIDDRLEAVIEFDPFGEVEIER